MSDENEVIKEEAFKTLLKQRYTVLNALETEILSCLPGEDGFADTKPVLDLVNGNVFQSTNILYLKEHQKQNDFPTAEYLTEENIKDANKDCPDISIREDQKEKSISICYESRNFFTHELQLESLRLFNVAQTTNPEQMKAWCEQKQQEKHQEYLDFMKKEYGLNYQLPQPEQKYPKLIIECTSIEPEIYLGQYLAAVSMGGEFKASTEQAVEFSQNLKSSLLELNEKGYPDPYKLFEIGKKATEYKRDVIEEALTELQEPAQTNTPEQSPISDRQLETAQRTGYVQGVCESVLAFNNDENRKIMTEATMTFLSKKLLSEMNVTKDMAQKFASPETYKALEQSVFAPKQEQHLEQQQSHGRGI